MGLRADSAAQVRNQTCACKLFNPTGTAGLRQSRDVFDQNHLASRQFFDVGRRMFFTPPQKLNRKLSRTPDQEGVTTGWRGFGGNGGGLAM